MSHFLEWKKIYFHHPFATEGHYPMSTEATVVFRVESVSHMGVLAMDVCANTGTSEKCHCSMTGNFVKTVKRFYSR